MRPRTSADLLKLQEELQEMLSPLQRRALAARLRENGRKQTMGLLAASGPVCAELLSADRRSRRIRFEALSPGDRPLLIYAALALATKTLLFLQRLDRENLTPLLALQLLSRLDSDPEWLWPFEDDGPFGLG